jgi:alpha-L-fucosidase
MNSLSRRDFVKYAGLGLAALNCSASDPADSPQRTAMLDWFRDTRFGLFLHYGVFSLLGKDAWVQYYDKIHVADYERLSRRFTAERFDANAITDLALAAGMQYVNLTTRHHDGFCLFDSKHTEFTSTRSPARRDLVAELAEQCGKKGLRLCLYYSHGRDWRHPHAPNNAEWGGSARPKYAEPDPAYATGAQHDLQRYVTYMKDQVTELLTQYGPVAVIWLDGLAVPKSRPGREAQFHCQELYDHIHRLQPGVLVSYKQGLTGTEDLLAPERAWHGAPAKPLEICDTLEPKGWGYVKADDGKHKQPPEVMKMLATAAARPASLLLNTGLLPDGSVPPEDARTLREVGRRKAV